MNEPKSDPGGPRIDAQSENPAVKASSLAPAVAFHEQLAPDWDKKYDKKIFDQRASRIAEVLSEFDVRDQQWVDAGCGTGTLSRLLVERGANVVGFDASPQMIEIADRNVTEIANPDRARFELVETIESMPLAEQSVDGVICSSVLEYLSDPSRALLEFHRVLRPGGVLLLTAPHRHSLLSLVLRTVFWMTSTFTSEPRPAYMKYSRNRYTSRELLKLMGDHDFTDGVVKFTSFWPKAVRQKHFGGICLYRGRKRTESDQSGIGNGL